MALVAAAIGACETPVVGGGADDGGREDAAVTADTEADGAVALDVGPGGDGFDEAESSAPADGDAAAETVADAGADDGAETDTGVTLDAGLDAVADSDAAADHDADAVPDADPDADAAVPALTAGLRETSRLNIPASPEGSPHLGEIAVDGQRIYLANSFAGVTALQQQGAGALTTTSAWTGIPSKPRCTTIAVHRPSATLYCATPAYGANGVASGAVSTYGLEEPGKPLVRDALALVQPDAAFADVEVVESTLYLAAFDGGLMRAPIGVDGALGAAVGTGIGSHSVAVTHVGAQLALLDLDEGLVLATHNASGPVKTGALPLDGPLLDVALHNKRVAVALGSAGVAVVDISGAAPVEVARVTPHGVAASVAIRDQALAVGCLSGLYLYDLSTSPPALRGFIAAHQVILDVVWSGEHVVASDWGMVFAARPDLAGVVVTPDSDRGQYVQPGVASSLRIANPGSAALDVRATGVTGAELAAATLPPESELDLAFPASLNPAGAPISVRLSTSQGDLTLAPPLFPRDIFLLKRAASHDPATGRPALGDAFPRMRVQSYPAETPLELPLAGVRQRVVGHADDCVAMWPQLRDLEWLAAKGTPPDGAQVIALAARGKNLPQFIAQWRLDHLTHASHDAPSGILLLDSGDIAYGPTLYSDVLFLGQWPGGAHHPSDYVVDEAGIVRGIERLYRGAWPLRPAL
ncbi:MAG: hypothetical protein R3F39_10405 [Myxococcota bacterium]